MSKKQEDIHITIVGAGLAGISCAVALKTRFGFQNFTIYEKAGDLGGTWRDNTYPGCACDVPAYWYSLSTEPNPNWSKVWPGQPEILRYWKGIAIKYNLASHIKFQHEVVKCVWDGDAHLYRVQVRNHGASTKEPQVVTQTSHVVISAIGGLAIPQYPKDISGRDVFKGAIWHSARWNHDYQLNGKRVGVVGNGCSAAQFVPKIAEDPSTTIVNFCRTPSWFSDPRQTKLSPVVRWMFAHIPLTMLLFRIWIWFRMDIAYMILWPQGSPLRKIGEKELIKYIKKTAPKKYHDQLIPDYAPGCKRIILDPGYLKCLHQENVSLNWDGIHKLVEDGVVTKTGEHIPLDAVIFSTGFDVLGLTFDIVGENGASMDDFYTRKGGPEAYLGTTAPGFPNFFTLLGPNVATGHASVIFEEEAQINYILKFVKLILDGEVKSFDLKESACDAYNVKLQKLLNSTSWTDCQSWYRAGTDRTGKIFAAFPGPVTRYWWWTLVVRWKDYKIDWNKGSKRLGSWWEVANTLTI